MLEKPNRSNRGSGKSLGVARQTSKPPEFEYRFDLLDEDEYKDCFRYEIQRYSLPRLRAGIQKELASIPADTEMPVEPDDVEGSVFARKRDLEEELVELKEYERPWLELRKTELPPHLTSSKKWLAQYNLPIKKRIAKDTYQPVQLLSRLDPFSRARLFVADSRFQKLEIFIDWTKPDTQLAASFSRLVKGMRKQCGKAQFKKEKRGRPKAPVEDDLFALAVWRCSSCGMTHAEIWDCLVELRSKWQIAKDKKRQLGALSRRIERLISQ
jgi:hypothetical protein